MTKKLFEACQAGMVFKWGGREFESPVPGGADGPAVGRSMADTQVATVTAG